MHSRRMTGTAWNADLRSARGPKGGSDGPPRARWRCQTPSRRPPVPQVRVRPPEAGGAGPHRENWPEVGVPSRHAIKRSGGQPGLGVPAGFTTGC